MQPVTILTIGKMTLGMDISSSVLVQRTRTRRQSRERIVVLKCLTMMCATTGKKGIFNMRGCFGDEPECDYDVCDERDTCPFFLDCIRTREIENDQIAHITEE